MLKRHQKDNENTMKTHLKKHNFEYEGAIVCMYFGLDEHRGASKCFPNQNSFCKVDVKSYFLLALKI